MAQKNKARRAGRGKGGGAKTAEPVSITTTGAFADLGTRKSKAVLNPAYQAWHDNMPFDTMAAIKAYTDADYMLINMPLRAGTYDPATSAHAEAISRMDNALANATPTPQNMMLYRGFGSAEIQNALLTGALVPGDVISDAGFLSTSTSKAVSGDWAEAKGAPIFYRMRTPQGSKGLGWVEPISASKGENEVIMGRGKRMRIDKVSWKTITGYGLDKNMAVVDLTVIPDYP